MLLQIGLFKPSPSPLFHGNNKRLCCFTPSTLVEKTWNGAMTHCLAELEAIRLANLNTGGRPKLSDGQMRGNWGSGGLAQENVFKTTSPRVLVNALSQITVKYER